MSLGAADPSEPARVAIIGPVFPYRAGIAYCTTRLTEEMSERLDVEIVSFARQYPRSFYPGESDIDPALESRRPAGARFRLDIMKPWTWLFEGLRLRRRRPDAVVIVWWIWVWALPYLVILSLLPRGIRVVLQCHNITDKEPARWKSWLTNRVLRRGDVVVVHAKTEAEEARRRLGRGSDRVVETFLPVHELGGAVPSRDEAKEALGLSGRDVALFFGHIRPFKGLDIALGAVAASMGDWTLLVAGEAWWGGEDVFREMARSMGVEERVRFDFRFIPDDEVATVFAAADVVITPYRREAQSGVALTAFHFGRPVIATNVGGLPEIIRNGENGFLVPPEDPRALARSVDRYFSSDRTAMEQSAAAAARQYSWERYAEVIEEALQAKGS
jgi:glycosyltransferase involved in cell wall biosynthesis